MNLDIKEQGVHMGVNGTYAGVSLVANQTGLAFIHFTYPNRGAYNNVAVIQCNLSATDPEMNFYHIQVLWLNAFKDRTCLRLKPQIGSHVNNKTAMLDVTGTCNITGDTPIGGILFTSIGDISAPNITSMTTFINSKANSATTYTKEESNSTFATLLNPKFTGQVSMNPSGRNDKTLHVMGVI